MNIEIIISDQYVPYLNLAVEQSLVQNNPPDTVVMYLWKNQRTVVIGLNQNPYTECQVDTLLAEGGYLMRRMTGGGAVYHDLENLNFSFVAPKKLYDQTKQFSVIQKAVRRFGIESELSGRNDLLCQGRKFSGNAFSVGKNNLLHHGTLLIRTETEKLQRYLKVKSSKLQKHGVKSVSSRVVNLSELAPVTAENIVPALTAAFQEVYGTKALFRDFNELCTAEVRKQAENFADESFLFGKWKHFHAQRTASFAWGEVEIDLEIDETEHVVRQVEIATDCLQLQEIERARSMLTGASWNNIPDLSHESGIVRDIFHLVFSE